MLRAKTLTLRNGKSWNEAFGSTTQRLFSSWAAAVPPAFCHRVLLRMNSLPPTTTKSNCAFLIPSIGAVIDPFAEARSRTRSNVYRVPDWRTVPLICTDLAEASAFVAAATICAGGLSAIPLAGAWVAAGLVVVEGVELVLPERMPQAAASSASPRQAVAAPAARAPGTSSFMHSSHYARAQPLNANAATPSELLLGEQIVPL